MRRWGELVLRHRKVVMLLWLVVAVAGISVTGTVNNRLTVEFSLPGQPGDDAANKIIEAFHNGGNTSPLIATVTLPAGQKITGHENTVAKSFAAIAAAWKLPDSVARLVRVKDSHPHAEPVLTDD